MSIDGGTSSTNSTLQESRVFNQLSGSEIDMTVTAPTVIQTGMINSGLATNKRAESLSAVDGRLLGRGTRYSLPSDITSTNSPPGMLATNAVLLHKYRTSRLGDSPADPSWHTWSCFCII